MPRFGIIGAGMIARYHAEAIANTPGALLAAICREDAAKAAEAAERFGVPCETSVAALLARPDVDAVCICTPSGQHAAQAMAAAQAGKHVLVEKPLALSLADADAMIAACTQANVRLGVALQRRTDPQFRSVRAAVESGELGEIVLGSISVPYLRTESYYQSAAWRGTWALDGGGALMNQGVHLVDLLLWLVGHPVVAIEARAATLAHSIEVEDCVTATLRFANGAMASIAATTAAAPGFPHRVEIYGTRGGVQIEGEAIVRWSTTAGEKIGAATPQAAGAGASPTGINTIGHTRIMADFVEAIEQGRDPLVTGADARRALAVVLGVYQAAGILPN